MMYTYMFVITLMCWSIQFAHAARPFCHKSGCRHGPGSLMCQSCVPGCFGSHCQHHCKGKCDIDGCDRDNGKCFKCEPGFYGHICQKPCPSDCGSSINDGIADCDRKTGACLEHCRLSKTGTHCLHNCSVYCKNSVCMKAGGVCFQGCKVGWWGQYCNRTCDNCLEGRCAQDGYCTIHCKPGYYGHLCDKKCSHGGKMCYTTGCDRKSGLCDQCYPGYHGDLCNKNCSANCYNGGDDNRDCDRSDGHCLEGCESGWHGRHCSTPCRSTCKRGECYNPQGRCTYGCEKGWYGSHCHQVCRDHCLQECRQHDGTCTTGCENGYHGRFCNNQCLNCDRCNQYSGECLKCPVGKFGVNCSESCINCQNDTCDKNGKCTIGCKNNMFYGNNCENKCSAQCLTCDKISGNCTLFVDKQSERTLTYTQHDTSASIHARFTYIVLLISICVTLPNDLVCAAL